MAGEVVSGEGGAVGVPDENQLLCADRLPDGLQVGDIPVDGVARGVVEPVGAAGPQLVVHVDVPPVGGELPEVLAVASQV